MLRRLSVLLPLWLLATACSGDSTTTSGEETDPGTFTPDKSGTQWAPYLEWSLENASYSGNPFDLVATVTFTHDASGEQRTTEMFYAGQDTWKFRFTGTRTGTWSFTTESSDPELDGRSGTVDISPNSDPDVHGFLTSVDNRFAVQVGENQLKGFLLNVFQVDDDGPYHHTHITTFENNTVSRAREYVRHARERGFTAVYVILNNNLLEMGAYGHDQTSSENPDLTAFRVLDDLVTTAHQEGMRIHFWRWGDESRSWTPIGLSGGINGTVDRRVTRYLAARLGPLPGWSMGYGFDLHEWTSRSELRTWFDDLQGWLGWEHLLSARSANLARSSGAINGYAQEDTEFGDFATDGFPSYATLTDDLDSDLDNPHLLEERNVLGRWNVDAVDTRRLMWRTAMAGGMGGWYGHFDEVDPVFGTDTGYPNPEQLKTHGQFWSDRFLLSFERNNTITDGTALVSSDNSNYVLYEENTSSITVDLSGMNGSQPAVAVNTTEAYNEIDLGTLSAGQHTIELPASADWAIAIGNFP